LKDLAIHISQISKIYERGTRSPESLRGTISSFFKPGFNQREEFKALDDINLDVKSGEVLGIIGPNGAGKSTLLKILARITAPSSGRVELWGKVGALLEIGTGFHPEMTGRENVFMNGSILGLSRNEIRSRFDEIVEFAGISRFIDTPVKHFSTGMQLRLGFAVAAHLNPDILLIDEVLAVGDLEFRQKCLGKMDEISQKQGRTILFVSHSLPSVSKICGRCILLENGQISNDGQPDMVIKQYEKKVSEELISSFNAEEYHPKPNYIKEVVLLNSHRLQSGNPLEITFRLKYDFALRPTIVVGIYSYSGEKIARISSHYDDLQYNINSEEILVTCKIEELPLVPGLYYMNLAILQSGLSVEQIDKIISFRVGVSHYYGIENLKQNDRSIIFLKQKWTQAPG
jgi:lipopolysaccharide transport system ATP-binding protein